MLMDDNMSANPPFDEVDAACLLCATVYIRAWGHQLGMVTLLELVDWTIFFFFFLHAVMKFICVLVLSETR